MMELKDGALVFRFPDVHEHAELRVVFHRTLRIPDDGGTYPLPPTLGKFPVRHVDDFAERVPEDWMRHGGVMLPMFQSEAMWLQFYSPRTYPFAIKVATGKINAVTGERWRDGLNRRPQDYMVAPGQPWLDGYCVRKGLIRQFVAMPLGAGYTAEEQVTGRADHGGLQISAIPLRGEVWERMQAKWRPPPLLDWLAGSGGHVTRGGAPEPAGATRSMEMGLAPGGRMRQSIHTDKRPLEDWDTRVSNRCFVHLANSLAWRHITGAEPPTAPRTAEEYTRHGLPWFDYYGEGRTAVGGSGILGGLKSVLQMGHEKGESPLPENASTDPFNLVHLRKGLRENEIREGAF
jgi:hypothetical protein